MTEYYCKRNEATPSELGPFAVLCLIISTCFINVLSISFPITALMIYDRVLQSHSQATLITLTLGAGVAIGLENVFRAIRTLILSRASAAGNYLNRNAFTRELLRNPTARPQLKTTLSAQLSALNPIQDYKLSKLTTAVDFVFVICFFCVVGIIDGWTVIIPLSLSLGFAAVFFFKAADATLWRNRHQDQARDRTNLAEHIGRSLHSIVALGVQVPIGSIFTQQEIDRSNSKFQTSLRDTLGRDLNAVFSQLLVGSILIAGTLSVLHGDLDIGGLAACTLLAGRALEPLQNCFDLFRKRHAAMQAREMLSVTGHVKRSVTCEPWQSAPGLRIRGASLLFDASHTGLPLPDMDVTPGSITVIKADQGTGKTTLAHSMLGLVPYSGTIELNGVDVSKYGPELRKQIGYVSRAPVLPAGRIRDVLTVRDHSRYADVRYLAEVIGLDASIKRLPAGYDTEIREDGTGALPPGVIQQIALCRTLSQKHKLLIFDDVTYAMDATTVVRFKELLRDMEGEATVIVLTDSAALLDVSRSQITLGGTHSPAPAHHGSDASGVAS